MAQTAIRLSDGKRNWYLVWSSMCDAPATYGMTLAEFKENHIRQHGGGTGYELNGRVARLKAKGISSYHHDSAEEVVSGNRAGAGGTNLSMAQIIDYYCINQPAEGEPERPRPVGKRWDPDAEEYV